MEKRKEKNALMVAYAFYETDNRVRRYAETLVNEGWCVDAIVLGANGQNKKEIISGVSVHRIQRRDRNEKNQLSYLSRIILFMIKSSLYLTIKHAFKKYSFIHVHSLPDFEIFAAAIAKMLGAKIVLDIHDIVPELYASKFRKGINSIVCKMLIVIEKLSCRFADHVIVSNDVWCDRLVKRSIGREKCTTILNYPVTEIFKKKLRKNRSDKSGKITLIYPGTLNYHQGLDVAIKAVARIRESLKMFEFQIYGKGPEEEKLKSMVVKEKLNNIIKFEEMIPLELVAQKMAMADIGIVPKRAEGYGGEAFSTKILEFMAVGTPVVISRTKIDQHYFDESLVLYFESGNEKDLAEKILFLINNPGKRAMLSNNALEFVKENSWGIKKGIYLDIVDTLVMSGKLKKKNALKKEQLLIESKN
ncbi:MAG: glycosyltransferase family 4 protein [bacterium]